MGGSKVRDNGYFLKTDFITHDSLQTISNGFTLVNLLISEIIYKHSLSFNSCRGW